MVSLQGWRVRLQGWRVRLQGWRVRLQGWRASSHRAGGSVYTRRRRNCGRVSSQGWRASLHSREAHLEVLDALNPRGVVQEELLHDVNVTVLRRQVEGGVPVLVRRVHVGALLMEPTRTCIAREKFGGGFNSSPAVFVFSGVGERLGAEMNSPVVKGPVKGLLAAWSLTCRSRFTRSASPRFAAEWSVDILARGCCRGVGGLWVRACDRSC
eukprot:1190945-Prorocentrum_minimum.AAC.1